MRWLWKKTTGKLFLRGFKFNWQT